MRNSKIIAFLLVVLLVSLVLPFQQAASQDNTGVYRATFAGADGYLTIEVLDDDLAHFELSLTEPNRSSIWTSPMIAKTDYDGPSALSLPEPNIIETPEMRLVVDTERLCIKVTDLTRDQLLTVTCPLTDALDGLTLSQVETTDIYGLGEQFPQHGTINQNWMGQRRTSPSGYGNVMSGFEGGNVGNLQIPIMYALGDGTDNYALFLDNVYQQDWNFSRDLFTVTVPSAPVRWYVMTGADLPDLRGDYMELTGYPLVPPRQMFGLWVSEYGYDNWREVNRVLESLRAAHFPVDGFVLDLQWFGGIQPGRSQMGSLTWDESNFPDPSAFIAALRDNEGVGVMTMEESYVDRNVASYPEALAREFLVRECPAPDCDPVFMDSWWGAGSMFDWTNPVAAAWWHNTRRQPLIEDGVMAHWTDLGEPENYVDTAWYYGIPEFDLHSHADIHNLYNLLWSKSIWQGYQRNGVEQRPFVLSRSGTAGSQRYGVALWSGDIGANLTSLAGHLNAQMQMSLSGIDYFGSDVGGFFRWSSDPTANADEVYTIWLANAVLLDVPIRPHTNNLGNDQATAPSLIGDIPSNLANIRLRYELSPYLYTLAHRAYRYAEPVFAPLVYYFQDDPNVRTLASQKMIGDALMMATITSNTNHVSVYLPAGGWFDYYTHKYYASTGQWFEVPVRVNGILRAPLFVRDGAIIPAMVVDDATFNILGQHSDGTFDTTLIATVYAANQGGDFILMEDDGVTVAYQAGMVRETAISHVATDTGLVINIAPAQGTFENAPSQRPIELRLVTPRTSFSGITLNGEALPLIESVQAEQGWLIEAPGVVLIKLNAIDVTTALHLELTN